MPAASRRWHPCEVDGLTSKLRAAALGVVALAALTGAPQAVGAAAAGSRNPFARFPGLRIEHYEVSGRTAEEIRASIDRHRALAPRSRRRFDGYTFWSMYWHVPGRPEGPCRVERALVMRQVTVSLPRLVDSGELSPAVRRRWRTYLRHLERHEATHVRHVYDGGRELVRAVRNSDCAAARGVAEAILEAMHRRNREYDRRTRHGLLEGAHFP